MDKQVLTASFGAIFFGDRCSGSARRVCRLVGFPILILLPMLLNPAYSEAQNSAPPSSAAAHLSAAEIQAGRQQMIHEILTTDMPGAARWGRGGCATEDISKSVAQARATGQVMMPDAADGCIAAMIRQAHDGALVSLYADILRLKTGKYDGATTLPQRIVEAIQNGSNMVDLGQGRQLTVTPGLALDAGFTMLTGRDLKPRSAL